MGQIPDMYYVSWHSLTNEGKVRADVELAEKLGIGLMQYDWEPRIAVPKPGGTEIRFRRPVTRICLVNKKKKATTSGRNR